MAATTAMAAVPDRDAVICTFCFVEKTRCTDPKKLLWCPGCQIYYCTPHWGKNPLHLISWQINHVKVRSDVSEWVSALTPALGGKDEQAKLHQEESIRFWFGVDATAHKSSFNENLFMELMIECQTARVPKNSNLFPYLISFVGPTGAGKSTIVKGLLRLDDGPNPAQGVKPASPVPGLAQSSVPTSSDVHLYLDPRSAASGHPLLLADCEGFTGGNNAPAATRYAKFKSNLCKIAQFKWPDNDTELSRSDCVEKVYPRMLYAFSDVVCYVLQQSPRCCEDSVAKLIKWAANVFNTSLNQTYLPHAMLIFNNVSFGTADNQMFNDDYANKTILGNMETWRICDPELKRLAEDWRSKPAPGRDEKETEETANMKDLFLRYFRGISVLYIPQAGGSHGQHVYHRLNRLRVMLSDLSDEAYKERKEADTLVDSTHMDRYLTKAFAHFSARFGEPFDFAKFAIPKTPLPASVGAHATDLMQRLRDEEPSQAKYEAKVTELLSSYASFQGLSKTPLDELPFSAGDSRRRALSTIEDYIDAYATAYDDFQSSSRCWYRLGEQQCRNCRTGHTKGHQDADGFVFAVGEYQTHHDSKALDAFKKKLLDVTKERILDLTTERINSEPTHVGARDSHLDTLKRNKEHLKKTKSTVSCYFCLSAVADVWLSCGHTMCARCLHVFGSQAGEGSRYRLEQCVLCSDSFHEIGGWTEMMLKPPELGARILAIDGGGVRGVISARILQLLENELGCGIPLAHFFDLVIGTSSGGILALELGANLSSAEKCLSVFEAFAAGAFSPRKISWLEWLFATRASYCDPEVLDACLSSAFPAHIRRRLIGDPAIVSRSLPVLARDLKVGVTAVTPEGKGFTIANYQRAKSDDVEIYQETPQDKKILICEAARCSSATPGLFPMYRAPNGRFFQDGGLKYNNPIGLAVEEARRIWPGHSPPFLCLSVGTGYSDGEGAKEPWASYIRNSWIERSTDDYGSKLDTEAMWRRYHDELDEASRARHVRLNVKVDGVLPPMNAYDQIGSLGEATQAYFASEGCAQLRSVAETILAGLFYPTNLRVTRPPSTGVYNVTCTVLCHLEPQSQVAILGRLESSRCAFLVRNGIREMPLKEQRDDLKNGQASRTFSQELSWESSTSAGSTPVFLVFGREEKDESGNPVPRREYHINGSPVGHTIKPGVGQC